MPSRLCRQTNVRRGYVKTIVTWRKNFNPKHTGKEWKPPIGCCLWGVSNEIVSKKKSGWILDLVGEGRILTKKLAEQVYSGLRKKLKLGPNDSSKELEVRRLHHVLKAARKRQVGKKNTEKAMEGVGSTMDNLETLPLLPPDLIEEIWQDRGWVWFRGSKYRLYRLAWHSTMSFMRLILCYLPTFLPFSLHAQAQEPWRLFVA